jgi:hypothetical protein
VRLPYKCYIKALSFEIFDNTNNGFFTALNNFSIKIKEIDQNIRVFAETGNEMSDSDGEFLSMDGGVTVFTKSGSLSLSTDPIHYFSNPFQYNGQKNLLIEITFQNPNITNKVNTNVNHIQPVDLCWDDVMEDICYPSSSIPYDQIRKVLKQTIIYSGDHDVRTATKGRLLEWRPIINLDLTTF